MCASDEADLCSIDDDLDSDPTAKTTTTMDEDDNYDGQLPDELRVSAAVPTAASLVLAGVGSKCAAAVALLGIAASSVPSAAATRSNMICGDLKGFCKDAARRDGA
jgi:hypothetical protein